MPPLCCYHWSQIIVKLKCSSFFAEAPYGDTPPGASRTPFYRGCLPHIVRTSAYACSVGSARPWLLSLFRLKVASLVKRQLFSVYECASLLRVSGAEKVNMLFFSCCHPIDYCCLNSADRPLQQRGLFNPTSLPVFSPEQNVYVVLDLSSLRRSRSVNMDLAALRMVSPIANL